MRKGECEEGGWSSGLVPENMPQLIVGIQLYDLNLDVDQLDLERGDYS